MKGRNDLVTMEMKADVHFCNDLYELREKIKEIRKMAIRLMIKARETYIVVEIQR
jgi:hypothetical protein